LLTLIFQLAAVNVSFFDDRALSRLSAFFYVNSEAHAAIALDPSWKRENLRFVVFLQGPKTIGIFGATPSSLPR